MSTILHSETEKFAAIADAWWDESGAFQPLHRLNPVRIGYIRDQVTKLIGLNNSSTDMVNRPFMGLDFLDIGCGGGLVAEPMARLGANITAIDAAEENIAIADAHAKLQDLAINYLVAAPESLSKNQKYDVILALEVIEHVDDHVLFLNTCVDLLKDDGVLILSTISRTISAFFLAKVVAEYIIKWVPKGTHDWRLFMRPDEVAYHLIKRGMVMRDVTGLSYNALFKSWSLTRKTEINYIMAVQKPKPKINNGADNVTNG